MRSNDIMHSTDTDFFPFGIDDNTEEKKQARTMRMDGECFTLFTREEMSMIRLGLSNIQEFSQSPDESWKVEGEVETLRKIMRLEIKK